jgi:hypothetical protein
MDPTNERWRDPTPPWLILGFLSFAAIGFGRDWRLGLGLFVFFAASVGLRWLLVLRYRRAVKLAGQVEATPDGTESA